MITNVPSRPDTTVALWDDLYLVRYPKLQTTSIEYLKTFGTYITGDKNIDKTLANEWITSMISISKMVDFYKDGAQIKIVNEGDVVKIYTAISDHLEQWINYLRFGINTGNSPIDDLIAMDRFAHEIYEHAKYHFNPNFLNSYLSNKMLNITKINAANIFSGLDMTKINEPDLVENKEPLEREPMTAYLRKHLIARNK